jgi:peptide-methionine (R)-S-oxide reductase
MTLPIQKPHKLIFSALIGTGLLGAWAIKKMLKTKEQAMPKVCKTDEEWKKDLNPEQYDVLCCEGTERPFSSALNDEKRPGVFVCAGCGLELFTSNAKFDSGTGWPSFFAVIPDHVETRTDNNLIMPRTEYHCARCGGHQGHVFDDGPAPTGLRYCNNGVALKFVPQKKA